MDIPGGRVFQAEWIASAKALEQEWAQHPEGKKKKNTSKVPRAAEE